MLYNVEQRQQELLDLGLTEFEVQLLTTPVKELTSEERFSADAAWEKRGQLQEAANEKWMAENPNSDLSTIYRERNGVA